MMLREEFVNESVGRGFTIHGGREEEGSERAGKGSEKGREEVAGKGGKGETYSVGGSGRAVHEDFPFVDVGFVEEAHFDAVWGGAGDVGEFLDGEVSGGVLRMAATTLAIRLLPDIAAGGGRS